MTLEQGQLEVGVVWMVDIRADGVRGETGFMVKTREKL